MKKDEPKIYCKFDKNGDSIEKVICKMFKDYSQYKNIKKGADKK